LFDPKEDMHMTQNVLKIDDIVQYFRDPACVNLGMWHQIGVEAGMHALDGFDEKDYRQNLDQGKLVGIQDKLTALNISTIEQLGAVMTNVKAKALSSLKCAVAEEGTKGWLMIANPLEIIEDLLRAESTGSFIWHGMKSAKSFH